MFTWAVHVSSTITGSCNGKNRPFPSFPVPLYQNEVKCLAFDMEITFHSQERLCTWPHFESESSWNSEVAY